jgi:nitroreductase
MAGDLIRSCDIRAMDDEPLKPDPPTIEIDLASVDRVLETTRSVRRRIDFDRPIDPELIERCIEIASQAPTGINAENWRFLVITSADKKSRLAALYRKAFEALSEARGIPMKPTQRALIDRFHEMPALILVCAEGRPPPESGAVQVGFYGSILPAAWSLMLALRARGLGSTWTSLLVLHEQEVAEILGIPDDVSQTILLPVGHMQGAVLKPAVRKPPHEVTYWEEWGKKRG